MSSGLLLLRGQLRQTLGPVASSPKPQALLLLTVLATWAPFLFLPSPTSWGGHSYLTCPPQNACCPVSSGPKIPPSHSHPNAHVPWSGCPAAASERRPVKPLKAVVRKHVAGSELVSPDTQQERSRTYREGKDARPRTAGRAGSWAVWGHEVLSTRKVGGRSVGSLLEMVTGSRKWVWPQRRLRTGGGFRESFPLVATCQGKEAAKTRGLGWARGWVLVLLRKIQQVL